MTKVIPLVDKDRKSFSAMDIETMEVRGEEIPISLCSCAKARASQLKLKRI
jgi:hypothetical protein